MTPSPSTTAAALGQIHGGADRARVLTSPAGPRSGPAGLSRPEIRRSTAGRETVWRHGKLSPYSRIIGIRGSGTGPQVADHVYQDRAQRHDAQSADRTFDVCLIMPLGEEFG